MICIFVFVVDIFFFFSNFQCDYLNFNSKLLFNFKNKSFFLSRNRTILN